MDDHDKWIWKLLDGNQHLLSTSYIYMEFLHLCVLFFLCVRIYPWRSPSARAHSWWKLRGKECEPKFWGWGFRNEGGADRGRAELSANGSRSANSHDVTKANESRKMEKASTLSRNCKNFICSIFFTSFVLFF